MKPLVIIRTKAPKNSTEQAALDALVAEEEAAGNLVQTTDLSKLGINPRPTRPVQPA